MKIAVCDDNKIARDNIVSLIKKQVSDADIMTFPSGEEMIAFGRNFDICFLDIAMKEVSGVDVAKHIREEREKAGGTKSILIFITGYREYMEEAFDVNAFHYLVKPIDEEKFAEVFKRAWKEASVAGAQNKKYIIIKYAGIWRKIFLKDIYYIESSNKKVIFHTKDGKWEAYGKMEELEEELGGTFYRCHRCYLVNLEKISAYSVNTIQVINGDRLILAGKKYPDFIRTYMRYAGNGGIVNV